MEYIGRTQVLWQHSGAAAITGMAKDTDLMLLPGTGAGANGTLGNFGGSPLATWWHRIDTRGAKRLELQYRSKIITAGGFNGALTANYGIIGLVGSRFEETDADLLPAVIQAAPPASGTLIAETDGLAYRFTGPQAGPTGHSILVPQAWNAVHWNGNTFFQSATTQPADTTYCSWGLEVGVSNSTVKSAAGDTFPSLNPTAYEPPLELHGIQAVYVAISFRFNTGGTYTASTSRIKCKLRALLYDDNDEPHTPGGDA